MPLDTATPLTPAWWLARLTKRLNEERKNVDTLDAYYRGDHPLPTMPEKFRPLFRVFQQQARSNYLALIVEATLERLRVGGFRVGDDAQADDAAWTRWQAAHLDADSVHVHRHMLALRRGYVMVGRHPRRDGILITPEHPTQVITEAYPDDARDVRAALKLWEDDITGRLRANVFLPKGESSDAGYVLRFEGTRDSAADLLGSTTPTLLLQLFREWRLIDSGPTGVDRVPIVPFTNRPDGKGGARGEFEDVLDVQNRINSTLFHRLVGEQFGSFRQKVILNYAFAEDDAGNPIPPDLKHDPGSAWFLDSDGERPLSFHEFSQTDTSGLIAAVSTDIRDLAAITRTPPHYLLGGIVNSSGDALKAAETGLVAKVKERMLQAGESWEDVMRLAAELDGDTTDLSQAEVVWSDPESRSIAELYDAAVKAKAADVPWRARMELLGKSPQEIDRLEAERISDAALEATMAPAPPAPGEEQGRTPSQAASDADLSARNGAPATESRT